MARGERPLLSRDNSDPDSSHRAEEEDALLTGQPINRAVDNRQRWREAGIIVWALLATIVVVVLSVVIQHEREELHKHRGGGSGSDEKPSGKRNLIFMVSDGMGPASLEMTRAWRQFTDNLPYDDVLVLDEHLIGSSRTRSTDSVITDSAAGATAFSCGFKSYNGAIAVLPDHTPCGTILEAAKKAGYMTGLVVTTRITDATPACFASHANVRSYEDLIAEHLIGHYPLGRMVDLIIGGGRCHFLPNTTEGSCRGDDKDVVHMAKKNGFNYIDNRKDFDNLDAEGGVKLPLLALLADRDIPYEIDRRHVTDQYPSEAEMATLALKALAAATSDSDKGFFIMIEGSRIDNAGHLNDPAAQVHEVLVHDRTFAAALDFLDKSDDEGILLSTSDHETGGLATAKQLGLPYPQYIWYPEVLANATNSATYMHRLWMDYVASPDFVTHTHVEKTKFLTKILDKNFGITNPTQDEIDQIIKEVANPFLPAVYLFAKMISRRAQIGWSTHGHSAVDVNIYASPNKHASKLRGNHENIEIGKFMAEYLDLDLDAVTKELIAGKTKTKPKGSNDDVEGLEWMGPIPQTVEVGRESEASLIDQYHAELRRWIS